MPGAFHERPLASEAPAVDCRLLQSMLGQGQEGNDVPADSPMVSGWQREYGLSMRKPNRKYKVPKAVMVERLEIGWLNVARIRALCLAVHGYDPEIENWDQSLFHHNESGSQNMPTLAVAGNGAIVPLIEGHSATRERWTANLTTFSNEERQKAECPPYYEKCSRPRQKAHWIAVCGSTSVIAHMDLGCLSRPPKKALTDKPTFSHSSIATCRRSMSSGRGDGGP